MPDTPSDRGRPSESIVDAPPGGPADARPSGAAQEKPDGTARLSRKRERSWRQKVMIPLVLAVVGLAMLLAGWLLYPSGAGNPTPGYSELILQSAVPVNYIEYGVNRVSAGSASMSVSVVLLQKTAVSARAASLQVWLPIGDTFAHCRGGGCHVLSSGQQETSYWTQPLTFRPSSSGSAATADFTVKAPISAQLSTASMPPLQSRRSGSAAPQRCSPSCKPGTPSAQPANTTGLPMSLRTPRATPQSGRNNSPSATRPAASRSVSTTLGRHTTTSCRSSPGPC